MKIKTGSLRFVADGTTARHCFADDILGLLFALVSRLVRRGILLRLKLGVSGATPLKPLAVILTACLVVKRHIVPLVRGYNTRFDYKSIAQNNLTRGRFRPPFYLLSL